MSFAGKVWRLLVGIKDGLVLMFMLLFFVGLFAILSARPSPGQVREGALLLALDGYVVEERAEIDPFAALLSREAPVTEYEARDLVRAIDAAVEDDRIKAVVLDLSLFLGGGQVHLQEIGEALDRVKAADKPVLAHSFGYSDSGLLLASHADEVWLDPMGLAYVAGPGGTALFYRDLLEKLRVNAKVYRVGTYKAAVEPYIRESFSEEARSNIQAIFATRWEEWQAHVKAAKPQANIELAAQDPVAFVQAAGGDLAQAAVEAGLVDKLGTYEEFGERVAEIAGEGIKDARRHTAAAGGDDGMAEVHSTLLKSSAQGIAALHRAIWIKNRSERQVAGGGYVSGREVVNGVLYLAGEPSTIARVEHLRVAALDIGEHVRLEPDAGGAGKFEACCTGRIGLSRFNRATFRFPFREAAVQDRDVFQSMRAAQEPRPRSGPDRTVIVENDPAVRCCSDTSQALGQLLGARERRGDR